MRDLLKFPVPATPAAALVLLLVSGSFAQQPTQPSIRVQSSLVLVDVISRSPKTGQPVRDFRKEDFRVLDDGQEVAIASFDSGLRNDARPIILWLVVICNEGGKVGGSREYAGKEAYFRSGLDHLGQHDTVGVAHWCDNGEAQLDLLPTDDRDSAIRVLAESIRPISFHVGGDSDELGEVSYRKMLRLIIQDAHRRNPQPLPAIVILDGDHTGQPRSELDKVVDDLLQTSGIVFGIKDAQAPFCCFLIIGEQGQISHYVAKQTGGQFFTASASGYAAALEMILAQLHSRYELGFVPPTIDGKRHKLKVELTKEAGRKHRGIQLRFRREYIPVHDEPEWAH
jgi:hypothetical protein